MEPKKTVLDLQMTPGPITKDVQNVLTAHQTELKMHEKVTRVSPLQPSDQ
jgi:hypothetical protein